MALADKQICVKGHNILFHKAYYWQAEKQTKNSQKFRDYVVLPLLRRTTNLGVDRCPAPKVNYELVHKGGGRHFFGH